MSGSAEAGLTALRIRYERACRLDLEEQTDECIEYLQNPEILVAEFADSFLTADAFDNREEDFHSEELPVPLRRRRTDDAVRRMVAAPALKVIGKEPYRFRYVARDIVPLWTAMSAKDGGDPLERRQFKGLDYVGITEEFDPVPVLGVVNPPDSEAPFLSLLRLLTCLAEVSTEAQLERANRFLFKNALNLPSPLDLHILNVAPDRDVKQAPLVQLSRDLADVFVARLREEWQFPNLLRNVIAMEMPSGRVEFDGILKPIWRISEPPPE